MYTTAKGKYVTIATNPQSLSEDLEVIHERLKERLGRDPSDAEVMTHLSVLFGVCLCTLCSHAVGDPGEALDAGLKLLTEQTRNLFKSSGFQGASETRQKFDA